MTDEGKWQLLQTGWNCPGGLLKKSFEVVKKRACPPIGKGGGYPGTFATNPVRS